MVGKMKRTVLFLVVIVLAVASIILIQLVNMGSVQTALQIQHRSNDLSMQRMFYILYYKPTAYITKRMNIEKDVDFQQCGNKNCKITVNAHQLNKSDVVIFDGRFVNKMLPRHPGQIWIFAAQEPPALYGNGPWKSKQWRSSFNLTKTYDRYNSDIFWPYGEIRRRSSVEVKNFTSIFYKKKKEVLIINSHCTTPAKRESFVKTLSKYITVDTLGLCGKRWECGRRYFHDDCFKIINNYKFYLSFENSFCRGYFTEKLFENFNYDTLMVVRGGMKGQAVKEFPDGTFISTDSFNTISELGSYLKNLSSSVTDYTRMLERKSQFYYPGYKAVFQDTMCRLCDTLNKLGQTNVTIPDIYHRIHESKPCRQPSDLVD